MGHVRAVVLAITALAVALAGCTSAASQGRRSSIQGAPTPTSYQRAAYLGLARTYQEPQVTAMDDYALVTLGVAACTDIRRGVPPKQVVHDASTAKPIPLTERAARIIVSGAMTVLCDDTVVETPDPNANVPAVN